VPLTNVSTLSNGSQDAFLTNTAGTPAFTPPESLAHKPGDDPYSGKVMKRISEYQGCQMVYVFANLESQFGYFWKVLEWKIPGIFGNAVL
jgi:hypothetical protein